MPILSPCEPLDIPECYTRPYDIARCLLDRARTGLLSFFPDCDECDQLAAYVNFGALPPADLCDKLVVSLVEVAPRRLNTNSMLWVHQLRYTVEVWVSGFPKAESAGDQYYVPFIVDQDAAAQRMLAIGDAMYRHVVGEWSLCEDLRSCATIEFTSMRPLGPQGGCAGWNFGVNVVP